MSQSLLPHCPEAEDVVLACVLSEPKMVMSYCQERKLTDEQFYLPANVMMFSAMLRIWTRGAHIDFATLAAELGPDYETAGGGIRISELSFLSVPPASVGDHITIIQDRFLLRKVIEISEGSKREASQHGSDGKSVVAGLLTALSAISVPDKKRPPTMKELVMDKFQRMERGEQSAQIIKTGFSKLDHFSPLKLGSMPLIAGERKSGKSMFALNLAVNVAEENRHRVLYFSLEDACAEVVDRITAKLTGIPIIKHDKSSLNEGDYMSISRAAQTMATMGMDIRDDVQDLHSIIAHIRQYKAEYPNLSVAVVDYAQLVRVPAVKGQNREQEVAMVSRAFRLLSLELKIALILLCQINKDGETRESKALEQDCTAMWKVSSPDEDKPNMRTIHIPFQRGGEGNIGFPLTFLGHLSRFENYAGEYDQPEPKQYTSHPPRRGK